MSHIICAVRGGPASYSTINHAIRLAKEEELPLTFLYVVNLDFMKQTMISRITSLEEDMRQMGEMILLMAADTALAQDVAARTEIREGDVVQQILSLCRQLDADHVVVGQPLSNKQRVLFNRERIEALGSELRQGCRADLVVVP